MLRNLLLGLAACLGLTAPASATWSIVLVNVRTGEIAVASATCLEGFDLAVGVPVVVVGKGAAAAQSFVDTSGQNRLTIRDGFLMGVAPSQILATLAMNDGGHQTRQYGIVDIRGEAIGFSGTGAGAYAGDRVGRVGDIAYAIQGNVITGGAVLAAAELALYTTVGDMGEMLMAAMEAAASYGGDGRCSCGDGRPTACGAPPPNFTKSAHVGFMIVARRGDTDGSCNASQGCANGNYYMRLNVARQTRNDPDPVVQLRGLYQQWQASQIGIPDHMLSTAVPTVSNLPVDGATRTEIVLTLRDREGTRITRGGAVVTAVSDPTGSTQVSPGTPIDNGDGTYTIPVTTGTQRGVARVLLTVDDGTGVRELGSPVEFRLDRTPLWTDRTELSAATGGRIAFAIQPTFPRFANSNFVLLASDTGTSPGLLIPPFLRLGLNPGPLFQATLYGAFSGQLPELVGRTNATAVANTSLDFPPGVYGIPIGTDVHFAYALFDSVVYLTSQPVAVRITP